MTDDDFTIADDGWDGVREDRAARPRCSTRSIAHVETCEWTVEAHDLRPPIEALGIKPRKVMQLLYVAVEGHRAGLPLFDSMLPARPRTQRWPGSRGPRAGRIGSGRRPRG